MTTVISKARELAKDLDQFSFDYDFYNYADNVVDRDEAINSLERAINEGRTQGEKKFLEEVIAEGDYMVDEAKSLLERLNNFRKEEE